jgi:hypothetical protein
VRSNRYAKKEFKKYIVTYWQYKQLDEYFFKGKCIKLALVDKTNDTKKNPSGNAELASIFALGRIQKCLKSQHYKVDY